jgi:tRNA(Ile)-lysidine synthase
VTDFRPVAHTRQAVRQLLKKAGRYSDVAVAVSGGADSLALAAATAYVTSRLDVTVHGLIVDHQLQPGSADVAATAAKQLHDLGIDDVQVLTVTVTGRGGPEAAARNARYNALRSAGFPLVLLGHTQDDQAETVLLGLGRGSGPRSITGMRDLDPPWARPFLSVPRVTTAGACEALGLTTWDDPHNVDPAYTRVRLRREVLPLLEDVLQGGVAPALARTAAQLRDDTEALDTLAARLLSAALTGDAARLGSGRQTAAELDVAVLSAEPPALRRRVLRRWLLDAGVPELSDAHLRSADALIGAWRGQGDTWLPGNFAVGRTRGRLRVSAWEPGEGSGCTATTSPPC